MQGYRPTHTFPTRGLEPEYNQLNFNLKRPTLTEDASIRFRKPGPIIVEKLWDDSRKDTGKNERPQMPLKMSVVSEEKLSIAIQLAKRDLMQRRFQKDHMVENQEMISPQKHAPESKRGTKKGKVASHRKDGKGESKSKHKQNAVVLVHPRSYTTESQGYILESNQKYKRFIRENPQSEGKVRTVTAPSPSSGSAHRDQDSKQAQEIKRLRQELSHYIQKIEALSRKGPSPVRDTSSKNHLVLDEADEQRKQARAVEQASRSARLLYALQQQVREIKDDLDRIGPSQIRHTKKSRTLNRLAAAHRGAVRALQTFIQQLPSQGETTTGSQPPMYQELGLLIRQLSLCCSQMEIGGAGVPDGILDILQEATEFQSNADERKQKTQLKMTSKMTSRKQNDYQGKEDQTQKKVMMSRTRKENATSSSPFSEKDLPVKDTAVFRTAASQVEESPRMRNTNKPGHDVHRLQEHQEFPMTSEREYALRASLDALIKAKGVQTQAATNGRPGQLRTNSRPGLYNPGSGRYHKAPKKTGVLLPKSKRLKRKNAEPQKQAIEEVHFTNATIASKLKTREVVKPPNNPIPPWSPGGVPRRIDIDLDNEGSIASDVMSPLNSPRLSPRASPRHNPRQSPRLSPRQSQRTARRRVHFEEGADSELDQLRTDFMEKEVARQAWLDKETEKKVLDMQSVRSKEIDRLTAEVIQEAEEAVRKKFQPLIEQQQQKQHQHTVEQQFDVGGRAIEGVVEDEAEQLHMIEDEILMEEKALDMQVDPTLEKLLQRLEEMETEEDIIRRRLQKITYSSCNEGAVQHKHTHEDDNSLTLKGTPLDGAELERMSLDVPVEHTSLKFTKNKKDIKSRKPQVHYRLPKYSSPDTQDINSDAENNLFRTEKTAICDEIYQEDRHRYFESRESDFNHEESKPELGTPYRHGNKTNTVACRTECSRLLEKPRTTLSIPRQSRKQIEECRGRFAQHLKKTSHHTYGAFNPWKLVEEVSDEILNELLEGVSDEIGSMTEVFVESLYKREFGASTNKTTS